MADIVGRDEEIGALESLLGDAIGGRGGALVLRGEAGIGKTSLMEHTTGSARESGLQVLSVTSVQAEGQIPYAGLEHLLRPVFRVPAGTASPYRLAVDVLNALGEQSRPTLLAVEDAHWLDAASWETLVFLCRRLESDPIVALMAVRDGADVDLRLAAAGLRELRLEPLLAVDADTLLRRTAPGLAAALRTRVLSEAAGNPLGLVELGSAAARSGGSALLPSSLPLSTRVEQTFGGLVAELPAQTRDLLLIAALNDTGNFGEILAAAAVLAGQEVPAEAVQPAVTTRLVTVDEQYELRFRHPLLRSALRQQAAPGLRRRVHSALAGVLAGQPQRQLWHRASATVGPDEALARDLTDVAVGAAQQQAVAVALAAVNRAVQLSVDPAERGRRELWAVRLAHEQGDSQTVRRILTTIDETSLRPADRARVALYRESYFPSAWSGEKQMLRYANLIDTIRREDDRDGAAQAMVDASLRVYYSNLSKPVRDRFVEITLAIGLDDDDPRLTAVLAMVAPVEQGARALDRLREFVHRSDIPPAWRLELAIGAWALGSYEIAGTLALSAAADARKQGRLGTLSQALNAAAAAQAGLGDTRAALTLAAECIALADDIGHSVWSLGGGLIAALAEALQGDTASALRRADHAEQVLTAGRKLPMLALVQRARGVAALAEGRADDAFGQLLRVFDPADSAWFPNQQLQLLGHLAEAALLGGFQEELRPVVAALEPVAELSRSPSLRLGIGFARAVLTGDYEPAMADSLASWPFDRARLQLAYGSSLRRSYRVAESRPLLRAAAATFDSLGIIPWADRARTELRATGETRRRPADALDALTPQEQQIARLASEGLSNREIGERLFLSPRTVSTHLYRIYPKINVRSRAELARVITSSDVI